MTPTRCHDPACTDGPALTDTDGHPIPDPPRLADSPRLLCRRCHQRLERRLAELPATLDALHAVLGGTVGGRGENARPKPGSRAPLVEDIHDHLQHVHATLVSWTLMVCQEQHLTVPRNLSTGRLASWLLARLDTLAAHPAAGDFAEEVRDCDRTARHLGRLDPQRHRLDAPCPEPDCGAHELHRYDGQSHVTCGACGHTWPEDEYTRLVLHVLDNRGGMVTAADVTALGIPGSTLRSWVARKQVRKLGTVDGVTRYSADDVHAMRAKEAG